jgi:hypothetical protein
MKYTTTKFLSTLVLLALGNTVSFSQTWQWAKTGGGASSDKSTDIVYDTVNNSIYASGYFNEIASFGNFNLPLINPSKESFVVKIDKQGNYQWAQRGTSYYDDRALGICADPFGNIIATGTCWGDIQWGSLYATNSTNYTDECYVVKLNAQGVPQWVIVAGNPEGDDHGLDAVTDKQGNIYVTGFTSDSYGFGNGIAEFGNININVPFGDTLAFVGKLSPNGVWQWVQTFDGNDSERDNRIAIDTSGNLYIAGGYYGIANFGTSTLTPIGGRDVFVVKYDKNGNFIWVKSAGGLQDDRANGVTVDVNQNVFITGEFRDYAAFGTDTINNNGGPAGRDIFVSMLRADGNWIWAKKAGSNNGGDRGNGITVNSKGNLFVCGQITDTSNFGGNITLIPNDTIDAFVAAIDTLGNWKWALSGGGTIEDRGNGIACDDSCNVYTAGYYNTGATFGNFNLTGAGGKDVFIVSVRNACFDYTGIRDGTEAALIINLYPNPTSNFFYVEFDNPNFSRATIQIIDLLGKVVLAAENIHGSNTSTIDIGHLPMGVYNIIINIGSHYSSKKLVKVN